MDTSVDAEARSARGAEEGPAPVTARHDLLVTDAEPAEQAPADLDRDRISLGKALEERSTEVGRHVNLEFAEELRGQAFLTARLGTLFIGRWLSTDRITPDDELAVVAQAGEQAMLEDASLASVAKAYLMWRDTTMTVVHEEARRLDVSEELEATVVSVVRASCDGALVRMVRKFDGARRSLQSRLAEEQATLAHRALHDQLTGLPNRVLFTDRLRQASRTRRRSGSVAMLLYLDLDDFKTINDRFGHSAGDSMLVAVAERLQGLVRVGDTVSRLGGDEFVVLADDLADPVASALSLAKRIQHTMRDPVVVGSRQLLSTVSIGIAPVDPDVAPEVSLARADAAMYQAKRRGQAHFELYNEQIGEEVRRNSEISEGLRWAKENGQFFLVYQPVFSTEGGLVGVEALLRWQHPTLGTVLPDEFIPMLERNREIISVGRWVLEAAIGQCRSWRDAGADGLNVTVNVSSVQLGERTFPDDVERILASSGLEADCLTLDVPESAITRDLGHMREVMRRLRSLGIHLALDNFGTGSTSLVFLQRLPFDRIKLDRRLVAELVQGEQVAALVSTVVEFTRRLGLRVVGQGAETEAQLDAVRQIGCHEVQGYLLGRPMAPEQLELSRRAPIFG
ncbi:MAG: putative bifunctional diguanylate cyclase/phosphodiesterase [Acidimicrobiales bacterium]